MGRQIRLSAIGNFADQPWGDRVPMPPLDNSWVDRYRVHRSLPGYPQVALNATPAMRHPGNISNPTSPYEPGSDGWFTSYAVGNNQYKPDYMMENRHQPEMYSENNVLDDLLEDRISLLLSIIVGLLFLNVLLMFFLFFQK